MPDPAKPADPDRAPPEVWDEIDKWLDDYEKSMRKGFDKYFGDKKDKTGPDKGSKEE
jgi:hypothetical protein